MTGYKRVESLNTDPQFIKGMADLVSAHLKSGERSSHQYKLRCPGLTLNLILAVAAALVVVLVVVVAYRGDNVLLRLLLEAQGWQWRL